jgi:hypothetical protein
MCLKRGSAVKAEILFKIGSRMTALIASLTSSYRDVKYSQTSGFGTSFRHADRKPAFVRKGASSTAGLSGRSSELIS